MVAGCMRNDGSAGTADVWSVYLAVADAAATIDAAVAQGGQVIVPPMQVMDLGTMAVLVDPGGSSIGLWQPGTHQGFGVLGEAGAPSWFELHTRRYEAAVNFYRNGFGWDIHTMSDTPEFRYSTLGEEENALAGIMDAASFPEAVPSQWSVYFGVENADAALVKIEELGGATIEPAMDTPHGRLAVATDPTGTLFRLVQA